MSLSPTGWILLTGAGLTHNMGAPLAKGMWANIFNHKSIESHPRLKDLMISDPDYESVYNGVLEGDYSPGETQAMETAVISAYESLDMTAREWVFRSTGPCQLDIYRMQELIATFASKLGQSFCFTLNQDLFLERHYINLPRATLPGIEPKSKWFSARFRGQLRPEDFCELPSGSELGQRKPTLLAGNFFYVKLHGSFNWLGASGDQRLVIGKNKLQQIDEEPLLSSYFELFRGISSSPRQWILIVGYGFRDAHINEVLAEAIQNVSLRIHVISPLPFSDFREDLNAAHCGEVILKGMDSYYQARSLTCSRRINLIRTHGRTDMQVGEVI